MPWLYLRVEMMISLSSIDSSAYYLLQVDVIQVIGAAHCLHHPALRCDHIKGEERSFRELDETGNWPWRHCVVGQENHIWLQDKAVKTVKTSKIKKLQIKMRAIPYILIQYKKKTSNLTSRSTDFFLYKTFLHI